MKYRPKTAIPGKTIHPMGHVLTVLLEHVTADHARGRGKKPCACNFRPFRPVEELPERPPVVVEQGTPARRIYRRRTGEAA